jgi:hypothetical protein
MSYVQMISGNNYVRYRMTRIKRDPCLGWEILKVGSKQMRDICFHKFGNTVKP